MSKKSLYLLCFITFLSMTGYGVVLPALPYLAESLNLRSFQMGMLITGWALAQFISVPFWGMLADKIGKKPVLLIGLGGFGAAFFLLVAADSYHSLLSIRIIGAILSSGMQPAALALVADSFDKRDRGKAISKMGAANGLGFLCGPVVGSLLTPLGMSAPFILSGILSLLAIPFAWRFIEEKNSREYRSQNDVKLIQSLNFLFAKQYREVFLVTFGMAVAASSLFSMLGYYLIESFSASPFETGAAFSIQSGAAVFVQLAIMSYIYKKHQEKSIAAFGLFIQAIGFVVIVFSFHLFVVYFGCILIGVGGALTRPTLISILAKQNSVGQGTVMGLQQAMDSLGRSVGPLAAGVAYIAAQFGPFLMSFILCFLLFIQFSLSNSFTKQPLKSNPLSKYR